MNWDAIVLAGGRGSRLGGVDKGSLEFEGESLLSRTIRAVAGASTVIVVGDVEVPGAIVVQEEPRFSGPAAAIGAGLAAAQAPYVVVLGCDHPFVGEAIPVLLGAARGDGAIAIDTVGRRQHLMAVLSTDALRASVRSRPTLTNLSVHAVFESLDLLEVEVPARSTLDIDTWHDRAQLIEREAEGAIDG